jgi:hypothetical protein
MTATITRVANWIRPWYPAGRVGHLYPDCPHLLRIEPDPAEGAGWLDPHQRNVCDPCLKRANYPMWNAHCHTCDWSLAEEKADDDAPIFTTQEEAIAWKRDHRCEPAVSLIPPKPMAPPQPADQPPLFPIADLTAVEAAA